MERITGYIMNFKKFIAENFDLQDYVRSDDFDMYKSRIANKFNDYIDDYGSSSTTVYRGLNFKSPKQYLNFMRSIRDGYYEVKEVDSAAFGLDDARTYAKSPMVYNLNPFVANLYGQSRKENERILGFIGIILKLQIKKNQALDLTKIGHSELLLGPGKYKILDVIKEKKYKHITNRLDVNNEVLDALYRKKKVDEKYLIYIIKQKYDDLLPETIELIRKQSENIIKESFNVDVNILKHDGFRRNPEKDFLYPDGRCEIIVDVNKSLILYELLDAKEHYVSRETKQLMLNRFNKTTSILKGKYCIVAFYGFKMSFLDKLFGIKVKETKHIADLFSRVYKRFNNEFVKEYNKNPEKYNIRTATEELSDVFKVFE
jgi:hypothetical protein